MTDELTAALIYGSVREGRFCDTVADWAAAEITRRGGFRLDRIDPAGLELPVRHERDGSPDLLTLKAQLAAADAFIVVTPEYNHSFPAALKQLIDSTRTEWRAKPVGFVSYGGLSGGLRAVEQLRLVFAELHTVGIRDTVSFAGAQARFDDAGRPHEPETARQAMGVMLAHLEWWARALKAARAADPYEDVAASARYPEMPTWKGNLS